MKICCREVGVCEEEGKDGDEEWMGEGFFDSLGERRFGGVGWGGLFLV